MITFVVCNCFDPLLSFRELQNSGASAILADEQFLQMSSEHSLSIHQEDMHFWMYATPEPKTSQEVMVSLRTYSVCCTEPIDIHFNVAPQYSKSTLKRVGSGWSDYWEFFKDTNTI